MNVNQRVARFPRGSRVTMEGLSTDPYPILAELRLHEPVTWVPETSMWFVTRHDDVLAVLADFETYTVDTEDSIIRQIFGRHMMTLDGPEQVRHKKQCMPMFRPRDLAATVGSSVDLRVTRLIDAFAGAKTVELRAQLARPLSLETVVQLLGLPLDQAPLIGGWYDQLADALANFSRDPDVRGRGSEAARKFASLVRSVLESFHGDSPDSLLKRLALTGDRLVDDEIISNALIVAFGGIETLEAQLCNTVWSLLSHPDQLAEVRADDALLDPAIEESLRWQPSVQSCTRYVTKDVVLRGVEFQKGDIVQCMLGAASRDPEQFPLPDDFDIHRGNARGHLSFGSRRHFCLGAPLARLEMRTAISSLLKRFPNLALDEKKPIVMTGYEFRKPDALWLTWETEGSAGRNKAAPSPV